MVEQHNPRARYMPLARNWEIIMSTIKYSPSTGNFYPASINYARNTLPSDLVEVSQVDYDTAMNRQLGSSFAFDKGKLVIIEAPKTKE